MQAVTGSGKTQVAIEAIRQHLADVKTCAVVVVPTTELLFQWRDELLGTLDVSVGLCYGSQKDRVGTNAITIFVAKTASRELQEQTAIASRTLRVMLVADEYHHYGAPTYAPMLAGDYCATLGLTATLERAYDDGIAEYVVPNLGQLIYDYTYRAALADHVIAEFRIAGVRLRFSDSEQRLYEDLSLKIGELRNRLLARHPWLEVNQHFIASVTQLANRDDDTTALAFMKAISERRTVLVEAGARHDFVTWLVTEGALHEKRTIAFHESIDRCEQLSSLLSSHGLRSAAHHSELSLKERKQLLSRFERGTIQVLCAPRTLDEGVDVPEASLAIIVAGTTIRRQAVQRIGRVLRRGQPDKQAIVFVCFVEGARDDPDYAFDDKSFMAEMTFLGRATIFDWPASQSLIAEWL